MDKNLKILFTDKVIKLTDGFNFVARDAHGAITSFLGVVRSVNEGESVIGITYDAYVRLAEKILQEICVESTNNYGKEIIQYIAHQVGYLPVGSITTAIYVSSPHRKQAMSACHYLIENLKKRAPIWKQEHYLNGSTKWLKGCCLA